jgi:hypothetical protein
VRRSLDTAGATTRDQRFAHLVSQGSMSNCALRDGSDGGGTDANANKIRLLAFLRKVQCRFARLSPLPHSSWRQEMPGARVNANPTSYRRSLAQGGTISHSPRIRGDYGRMSFSSRTKSREILPRQNFTLRNLMRRWPRKSPPLIQR